MSLIVVRWLILGQLCQARYLLAERSLDNLVGPHVDELKEAGTTTVYFDQALFEGLTDTTPLPAHRRSGVKPDEVRSLIYTSGTLVKTNEAFGF
jgi:hypothetical protein